MKDLIEYMARAIVEYPDEVVVTEEEERDFIVSVEGSVFTV